MSVFDEINEEQSKKEQSQTAEAIMEIPEAMQVLTSNKLYNGSIHEEIIDTFVVDKKNGIIPIEKAKNKAKAMKRVFPDKTYYVVGIYKRIEATY